MHLNMPGSISSSMLCHNPYISRINIECINCGLTICTGSNLNIAYISMNGYPSATICLYLQQFILTLPSAKIDCIDILNLKFCRLFLYRNSVFFLSIWIMINKIQRIILFNGRFPASYNKQSIRIVGRRLFFLKC